MSLDRIPLTRPTLGDAELARVSAVLASGQLVNGPMVAAFEDAVCTTLGVEAVACATGTTAIQLGLIALGVGPGDEVVVPDFCFPSVAAAVTFVGADPVLCDVDPASFCATPETVAPALSGRTRAVIAVHQFGVPANARAIRLSAGLPVLEDACCALGARELDGSYCGTTTELGAISLHPRKVVTTGEGGLVLTRDAAVAARLRSLRNHGMARQPDGSIAFTEIGIPGRMSDLEAALGLAQLERLDAILQGRARAAAWYRERLAHLERVVAPSPLWQTGRAYQGMVVRLAVSTAAARDAVMGTLRAGGIECTIGTYAIHELAPYQRRCRVPASGLDGSAMCARTSLTLPLWPEMPESAVDRVCATLADALRLR